MSEEKKSVFKDEIKYIVFIALFISSVIFNYFTTVKQVDLNTYRIGKVETARIIAWDKYDINCEKQTQALEVITKDLIKIKVKLGIED